MNRRAARATVVGLATAGLVAATVSPALATHSHVLLTPGACVDRGGAGFGTGEAHDHPSFHSQVHRGTPGVFAFERPGNPVSVVGFRLC